MIELALLYGVMIYYHHWTVLIICALLNTVQWTINRRLE